MLLKWFSKSKCHLQMISILSTAGALTTTVLERQLNMVILDRTLRSDEQRTQNLPNIEYFVADPIAHKEELLELNIEYMTWVCQGVESHFAIPAEEVLGMPASQYVPTVIDKVCGAPPPKGIFYLVKVDGNLAGMGGIRYVRENVCEIKRIYFRPAFRGNRLGDHMLNRLISDAKSFGYKSALLDSGPFMTSAHRVYERCGFQDCAPYQEAEVPSEFHSGWRFMQRTL
jgi:GNAT superfamily N-acetyltransferase